MNAYRAADFIEQCQRDDAVGALLQEQIDYLNRSLPGWRNVDVEAMRTEAWLEGLSVGYELSVQSAPRWLQNQQQQAQRGTLPAEQCRRLNTALPGWLTA